MNHRTGSIVFGVVVGLAVAVWSYQWITDADRRTERVRQESAVLVARDLLASSLRLENLEIVDPVSPQRRVGKSYIYSAAAGWEVSGYYRRNEADDWHAYLLTLGPDNSLMHLKVQDSTDGIAELALSDPRLDVLD